MIARSVAAAAWVLFLGAPAPAQAPAAPGAREPVLRVEGGGPTAFVTALAFSPDGKTLYAAGYDKVVRVWVLDAKADRFVLSSTSYRVPIASGLGGVINAIAVSADGAWLAAGGSGVIRGVGSAREVGWVVPRAGAMTKEMRQDEGTIWAFNTRTGAVRALRGHEGPVLSLAFDAVPRDGGPFLASSAREGDSVAVRLWDLSKAAGGAALSALPGGKLPKPTHTGANGRERITRPGLAVYVSPKTGPVVAVACDDDEKAVGYLRLWEGGDGPLREKKDGYNNTTVAYWPEEDRLLSATVWQGQAYLQAWSVVAGQGPQADAGRALALGQVEAPRALALLSSRGDGRRDQAALVCQSPGDKPAFSLRLVNLATFKARDATRPFVLWRGTTQPAVAASPRGRFLAVAGNSDHTIRIYAVADLLDGKTEPHQPPLRSEGATPRYVCFVARGKDRGLLLNETEVKVWDKPAREPGEAGDLVFDFVHGKLAPPEGWKNDAPDLKGWAVERRAGNSILRVRHNDRVAGEVALRPGQELTDYALLPASPPPLRTPLLAVAFVEEGETLLALYDLSTGEQVRQCTGPVNPVRSLAFSGDGRLLAAASDDQTVSVWSLTTLDEVIGRHGQLRGLAIKEGDGGRPIVAEVDKASLPPDNRDALKEVQPGDAVKGLFVDGKLKPTPTPRDFYRAVWEIAPSKQKAVKVSIGGREVTLAVSQGVDERKPLLSLFLTAGGGAGRDWVGWSPVGPFDSSGARAEKLVGWHVNTGEANRPPARFVLADQFRKDNYKPGILNKLIEHGNPGQALDAWQRDQRPPPDPEMTFGVKDDGVAVPPDRPGHFTVGERKVTLTLALDGFPAERVGSLEWQALGKRGALTAAGDGEWTADLSDLPWERGEQAVKVLLRTTAPHARDYSGALTVRYQPPAPLVKALREHPGATDREKYPVALKVTPRGQAVRIAVLLNGKPVQQWKDVRDAKEVRTELELVAGENRIQVVAENQDAPKDAAGDAERVRWDRGVTYRVPRPQVTLRKLVLDESERNIDPEKPEAALVVDVPTFRVVGEVEALADLAAVEWAAGEDKPTALTGFDPAKKMRKAAIDQTITLREPGKQKLRFLARAAGGDKAERTVTVEYRPRLPAARATEPGNQRDLYEGETPPRVPVEVALSWPKDARPCAARLVVNGKEQGESRPVAAGAKTFKAEATLEPGENRIEVRLSNKWQSAPEVAAQVVYYQRPPRVVKVEAGTPGDRPPRVEVVATIESANDLPLDGAALSVWREREGGGEVTGDAVKSVPVSPGEMTSVKGDKVTTWTIRKAVPLDEGTNAVRLTASNRDGAARKPGAVSVSYRKPPPPRPVVTFLKPQDDTAVESPDYEVQVVVTSASPLTKAELRRGSEALFTATAEQLRAQKKEGGSYRLALTHRLSLNRGANLLCAVTANEDGGEAVTPYRTVTYHYRPVLRVHIDALEVNGKVRRPEGEPPRDGPLPFGKVSAGKVTLVGHVSWDQEHDAAVAGLRQVEVTVNGYHQPPALLGRPAAGERRRDFTAEVLLGEENNVIDVAPPRADPAYVVEAGSRPRGRVASDAPVKVTRRMIHLLVIDVDSDRERAVKEALEAILADHLERKDFKVSYCSDGGHLYGPLAGDDVIPEAVYGQMALVQQNLAARARAGARNDVVMVYYRGGLVNRGGGQFLQSSLSRQSREPRPSTLISCDHLARFLADSPGAQLVFLDVAGEPSRDRRADLVAGRSEPHVAVLRTMWSGEPAKQPAEARLRPNLERALARPRELGQVRWEFTKPFDVSGKRQPWPSRDYKGWWYDDWLPPALEGLRLGGPAAP